jgi:hypothetical protein
MGVVIETCIKYPGGPTRITVADIRYGVRYAVYGIRYINTVRYVNRTSLGDYGVS